MVPTFARPEHLRCCLAALEGQSLPAYEIIVVVRPEDRATHELMGAIHPNSSLPLRQAIVREPGNVLSLAAGIRESTGDVTALTDDDAEPCPDWLEQLAWPYASADVGGVGGLLEEFVEGRRIERKVLRRPGRLKWYGNYTGGFDRIDPHRPPFEVDFLRGANMSYRTREWRSVGVDPVLNRADYHFEVDIGLRIRGRGLRIVCNPAARVRHHNAGRTIDTVYGTPSAGLMRRRSHNFAYALLKNLPPARRVFFLLWLWGVGNKSSWGLLYFLASGWRLAQEHRMERLSSAFAGKWEGWKSYRHSQTDRPSGL